MGIREFAYIDARGTKGRHKVVITSEDETYIRGFCEYANGPRTYRRERIQFDIDGNTPIEILSEYPRAEYSSPKPRKQKREVKIQIHFTGFKSADKAFLQQKAEEIDMDVRSSVTNTLSFLCVGYNASKNKIAKAEAQGVPILTEEDFFELIDTGALPG